MIKDCPIWEIEWKKEINEKELKEKAKKEKGRICHGSTLGFRLRRIK